MMMVMKPTVLPCVIMQRTSIQLNSASIIKKLTADLPYISYNSGQQTITGASTNKASNVARGAAAVGLGGLAASGNTWRAYNPQYNAIRLMIRMGL